MENKYSLRKLRGGSNILYTTKKIVANTGNMCYDRVSDEVYRYNYKDTEKEHHVIVATTDDALIKRHPELLNNQLFIDYMLDVLGDKFVNIFND